ncbi:MAG: LacI family DNA-binding transcriptional regulator [Christensenellales bacterium]|jgi:DNA-binding LacI/PurR family transcriptional regulator
MRITIREIAREAGVSAATVSLVLNKKKGVSDETREHVQEVLDRHNYSPSRNRKRNKTLSLATIKYRVHGMAVEENQGFIASILDQIELECRKQSYRLVNLNCDTNHVIPCIEDLNSSAPDGVILIGTELPENNCGWLSRFSSPVVVLDNSMTDYEIDSITMDNRSIMKKAVLHLYAMGHRNIGYLKSNRHLSNLRERFEGYLSTMRELGLTPPEPILLTPTLNGACADMAEQINSCKYISAAVADNDSIALGASKALKEAGFKLPEDLSIVGVDDIPFSAITTPSLSTVRISRSAMGVLAVALIKKRIENPDWPTMRIAIDGQLKCRNSVSAFENSKKLA